MKLENKCSTLENGNLKWKIDRYIPNALIAIIMLIFSSIILCVLIFNEQYKLFSGITKWSFFVWCVIIYVIITYITSINTIIKRLFFNYIVEVIFKENELEIIYKKGNKKKVKHSEIGFIDFTLTNGIGIRERFYPCLTFYYKDDNIKVLDDVLYKKGYLIFKGEIFKEEDYLILEDFLNRKDLHFYEPENTIKMFEKGRILN